MNAIWDLDTFTINELDRLIDIDKELKEMGLDGLNEDMMLEVHAELSRRDADWPAC